MWQPETLKDSGFGEMELMIATEESVDTDGMSKREDGRIEVDAYASLLAVDVGLTWRKTDFCVEFRGAEGVEVDVSSRCIMLCLEAMFRIRRRAADGCRTSSSRRWST